MNLATNDLKHESSPYLLQHQDNPVHWQGWSEEVLQEAKRLDKPILLSVGYAACHWCHVMAHESFEDTATAEVMNDLFINVKVDREERPDIDHIYQQALALLGKQGGWPLTMFLMPDGRPFFGGTYFPNAPRYGMPAFTEILQRISDVYHKDRQAVVDNASNLHEAIERQTLAGEPVSLPRDLVERVGPHLIDRVDFNLGGLEGAPKFPQVSYFALIWQAYLRTGNEKLGEAVTVTLDRMCQGGIYDHLGGGFARYSTDEHWLAPHFEKMLYDNAQLIDLLSQTWRKTKSPLYAQRIAETVEWLEREMITPDGAFCATLDADSEGVEGKFYVWDQAEIESLLDPESLSLFLKTYDVSPRGNWEGKTILNRSNALEDLTEAEEALLAQARDTLLTARAKRIRPGLDDKVLADWNGMMIAALALASRLFQRSDWLSLAEKAYGFVTESMMKDDRLYHSWRADKLLKVGLLEDYAQMARAALALYEATGQLDYRHQAEALVKTTLAHYWDNDHGGFFHTAEDQQDIISRAKPADDYAIPSGNAIMAQVLVRLFLLTGHNRYRDYAEALFQHFSPHMARYAGSCPGLFIAWDLYHKGAVISLAGDKTEALLAALADIPLPHEVINHHDGNKSPVDGQATAYLCIGTTCQAPVTSTQALLDQINHFALEH